jgi:glycosyltransferase involved in cell wall biosynthesis
MRHVIVIADLGYGSPYWIDYCESLVRYGNKVTVISPKMSLFQRLFLGIPIRPKFQIAETRNFRMFYRREQSIPKPIRVLKRILIGSTDLRRSEFASHTLWIKEAVRLSKDIYGKSPFHAVLSTSMPIESHIIGMEIKIQFNIPWVADYRDPFTFNHTRIDHPTPQEVAWEKNLLKFADHVTTTSLGFSNAIAKVFDGNISVVQNGFRELYKKKKKVLTTPIEILYPGQIYKDFQNPLLILEALDRINTKSEIFFRITFSGVSTGIVKEFCLGVFGKVPAWVDLRRQFALKKSLNLQKRADLLLLLNWEGLDQSGVMQTKLYEYVASGTFVLASGGSGSDESSKLLVRSKAGVILTSSHEIENFLMQLIVNRDLPLDRDYVYINSLSRYHQALVFHQIINTLTEPNKSQNG